MNRYGIDLLFSERMIRWDVMRMAMKSPEDTMMTPRPEDPDIDQQVLSAEEDWSEHYAQQIMDSKCDKQDLVRLARDQTQLTVEQRNDLQHLLEKHADLFDGELGQWPDEDVSVELTPEAVPYHCGRPMRIPHIHMETVKKEVNRLVEIGVLEVVDGATAGPWCAPSFIVPKKDGHVKFITDYRELNKKIRRMPHALRMCYWMWDPTHA